MPPQSRPALYERFEIDGLVFVTALQRGRGKASGVPIQSEVTLVFTVRQGVIHRWQMFRSRPGSFRRRQVGQVSPVREPRIMTGRSSQPSPANDLNQVLAKIGDRELHLRVAA